MADENLNLFELGAPLILGLLGIVVLLLGLSLGSARQRVMLPALSYLGLLAAAVLSGVSASHVSGMSHALLQADTQPETFFGEGIVNDPFGGLCNIVLCLAAALTVGMAGRYLEEKRLPRCEFHALILFATSGAMFMVQGIDLINVFVGLEVLSVSLYILAGFSRREMRSEEAAVKYFLLGAFASGFLLFGIALIYGAVGLSAIQAQIQLKGYSLTSLYVIGQVLRISSATAFNVASSPLFVVGLSLVMVGLGFKAALVPFHSYAPDVYEGAPAPVSAFMSVVTKVAAFAAFIRLLQPLLIVAGDLRMIHNVLWGLAAATILVGNLLAIRQVSFKRLLAYSSIAHAGYLAVGLLACSRPGGSGTASDAMAFYFLAYTLMNLGAFAVIVWLGRDGGEFVRIDDFAGLARREPVAAAVLTALLLSLAGLPPTAGFVAKLYLFLAAFQSGLPGLAILGLTLSVLGVFYYLNLVVAMFFRPPVGEAQAPRAGGARHVATLAAVATVLLGLFPASFFTPRLGLTMKEIPLRDNPIIKALIRQRANGGAPAPGRRPSLAPGRGMPMPGGPPGGGMRPPQAPGGPGRTGGARAVPIDAPPPGRAPQ